LNLPKVQQVQLALKDLRVIKDCKDPRGIRVTKEIEVSPEYKVLLDLQDQKGNKGLPEIFNVQLVILFPILF